MGALKIAATVVLVLFELFLIIVVLLQQGKSAGLSASLGGGTETFFGKNKSRSFEGRLQRLTTISALGFIVVSIILAIL
ncbi:MAG: preprotein translocase subunit SecG [Clostridiales bacterium]|jgi:preprotein translocase subunit SecG|nr:preprotein translocase subunit SecG [Clostridiales bacterium]